ncbi:hypothetical protein T484DRAFT_2871927 [Baffinella frigidus]|nr:hypothetical protein T484DRAFT_2871927 [Cryptophyta sp. CCMP2293]
MRTLILLGMLSAAAAFSTPSLMSLPTRAATRSGATALQCRSEEPQAAGSKHSRITFLRLAAATALAATQSAGVLPAWAEASGGLDCRAQIGGGTKCNNQKKEKEFVKAYDTTGTQTKVTGDKNKMSTYYSQIEAGYETLVDLGDRWDAYVAAGDGDVIRRRLGTVGTKSPLHNILKAFEGALMVAAKSPEFEQEQLDALEADSNIIMQGIAEIDYNLYATSFVGTEEIAGGLRGDGRIALDRILITYLKFNKNIAVAL